MRLLSVSRVSNLMRYPTRFWNTPGSFEMSAPCFYRQVHRLGIVSRIDTKTNLSAITFQVRSLSFAFLASIKVKVIKVVPWFDLCFLISGLEQSHDFSVKICLPLHSAILQFEQREGDWPPFSFNAYEGGRVVLCPFHESCVADVIRRLSFIYGQKTKRLQLHQKIACYLIADSVKIGRNNGILSVGRYGVIGNAISQRKSIGIALPYIPPVNFDVRAWRRGFIRCARKCCARQPNKGPKPSRLHHTLSPGGIITLRDIHKVKLEPSAVARVFLSI